MKLLFFCLFILLSSNAAALLPIEGILLGKVDPNKQYDPLLGALNKKDNAGLTNSKEKRYRALYIQGTELVQSCIDGKEESYKNIEQKNNARRTILSTLQYIGIDRSLRAIIEYAKKLEISNSDFKKLVNNLIQTSCNPNISVYGIKLIKDNFDYYWNVDTNFSIPSLASSELYSRELSILQSQKSVMEKEFNYSLKNFRAFCSWNSDTDNISLLPPYVRDPFVISYLINNIVSQKISFDKKTEDLVFEDDPSSVQMLCQNMICRRVDKTNFLQNFPRMIGSISIRNDLERMYCSYLSKQQYSYKDLAYPYKEWIDEQGEMDSILEVGQFLALITGVPETLFLYDNFDQIDDVLQKNIKDNWKEWAINKIENLEYNILYEETVRVKLVENSSFKIQRGDFQIDFELTLGEFDLILDQVDKLSSTFELKFSKKFLSDYRKKYIYYFNRADDFELENLVSKFKQYLAHQLSDKKKFFEVPLWNDDLVNLLEKELSRQLISYNGKKIKSTVDSEDFEIIPVKFHYGLFALKYIRDKRLEKNYQQSILTFKK